MGTILGPKYVPYSYMEPLGMLILSSQRNEMSGSRLLLTYPPDSLCKDRLHGDFLSAIQG